ncbi:hypothetical protein LTR95_019568, partial [Oleoguttula sp. CCFEE 5521]
MLYSCYDLIPLHTVMELSWRHNLTDFTMPFMINFLSQQAATIEELKRDNEARKEREKSERKEEETGPILGGSRLMLTQGGVQPQPTGGYGGMNGGFGGLVIDLTRYTARGHGRIREVPRFLPSYIEFVPTAPRETARKESPIYAHYHDLQFVQSERSHPHSAAMPGFPRLSLVEGSFEELALELATYLDQQKGEESDVLSTITPKIADPEQEGRPAETDKDAVLESLVGASDVLNSAPEKELQAAYNLLIHLISQSEDPDNYIRSICLNLRKPITSSPANNTGIALSILGTIFNTLDPDDSTRYNVLTLIIEL